MGGIATAAAAGACIALPAVRHRQAAAVGTATLVMAFAIPSILLDGRFLPALAALVPAPEVHLLGIDLAGGRAAYLTAVAVLVLTLVVAQRLPNTRGERGASRSRLVAACAASGGLAGLAGAALLIQQGGLPGGILGPEASMTLACAALVGGVVSVAGPVAGAVYLAVINFSAVTQQPLAQFLAAGLGGLVVLTLVPVGVGEAVRQRLARVMRR